ncbi:MAG: response regulator transcription factor [Flavisolibacter sp.]
MRTVVIGFGLLILSLLVLFKISEVNFLQGNVRLEIIVAIAAIIFFFIGVYFNRPLKEKIRENSNSPIITQPQVNGLHLSIDYEQIKKIGLTQREHDVLVKMAEGMSNQEIATALFLSESTIKTHVSNILFKLDVKRRTAAIQAAKQLNIIH